MRAVFDEANARVVLTPENNNEFVWLRDVLPTRKFEVVAVDPLKPPFESRYQIPAPGVDPSREMVEWLHINPEKWDGDESGITLYHADGSTEFGRPGDWIACADGRYYVIKG